RCAPIATQGQDLPVNSARRVPAYRTVRVNCGRLPDLPAWQNRVRSSPDSRHAGQRLEHFQLSAKLGHSRAPFALTSTSARPVTEQEGERPGHSIRRLSAQNGEGVFIPAFSSPGFDSTPGVILAKHSPKFPTALRGLLAKPFLKQDR